MGELRILCHEGDTKVIWDPENNDEVTAAKEQFDSLIKRGFTAYKVNEKHEKGKVMKKFDPDAGKVILAPKIVGG